MVTPAYWRVDTPTLHEIVVAVTPVIAISFLWWGSVVRGYACCEEWLSLAQVNVIPPVAIPIVSLVVNPWPDGTVIVRTPVEGM